MTQYYCDLWRYNNFVAPVSVQNKMNKAKLDWLVELTQTLAIWINKDKKLTDGELILAWTNLGAIVECWLKFFFCVFYEDYKRSAFAINYKGKFIEPNSSNFDSLIANNIGILWDNEEDCEHQWVKEVQHNRNAIHAFNPREIGDEASFLEGILKLEVFVDHVTAHFPPIEDYLDCFEH